MQFFTKKIFFIFIFFNVLFLNIQVLGKPNNSFPQSEETAFENWKKSFKKQAINYGFSESFISFVLPRLHYLPKVLEADKKQSEFLLTFWKYTDKVLSRPRVQEGRENAQKYKNLLNKVYEKYHVAPKYILAFWGLETNYGRNKGDIDTLDALATLAYDKRRRAFFTKELLTLLKMIEKGETPAVFKGSWAGAFGNFQFMPTTYAAYAVDATGDGKKDIINSLPDAFESAANYLSKMGWQNNQLWGKEVILSRPLDWRKIPENSKMAVKDWQKMGVLPACGEKWTETELNETAKLVLPGGIEGPAFLTFKNYDYIMRWNNSSLYALSVGLLSNQIESENAALCSKRTDSLISRGDIRFIQQKLAEKGYYTSAVDGILGRNTKKAIRAYQKNTGQDIDGFPSQKLIESLKGK